MTPGDLEAGDEVRVGGLGPLVGLDRQAVTGSSDLQEGERRAAAHHELAVVGVDHGQAADTVGAHLDHGVGDSEFPRLGVVTRGCQHREAHQRSQLVVITRTVGYQCLGLLPRIQIRHRVLLS